MPCDPRISSPLGYLEAENWLVVFIIKTADHSGDSIQSNDRKGPPGLSLFPCMCFFTWNQIIMVVVIFFSPKPRPYSGNSATWLWLKIPKKWFYPQKNLQHRMAMLILDTPNIRIRLKMGYTPNYGQLIWATRIFPSRYLKVFPVDAFDLHLHFADHTTPEMVTRVTMRSMRSNSYGKLGKPCPIYPIRNHLEQKTWQRWQSWVDVTWSTQELRNIPDTTLDNIVVFQISSCEKVFVTRD